MWEIKLAIPLMLMRLFSIFSTKFAIRCKIVHGFGNIVLFLWFGILLADKRPFSFFLGEKCRCKGKERNAIAKTATVFLQKKYSIEKKKEQECGEYPFIFRAHCSAWKQEKNAIPR